MIGFRPGLYWRVCWRFAAPAFLLFITAYGLLDYEPLQYEGYVYPGWANALGWAIAGSSVLCIPTVAIFKLLTTKGTFFEVNFAIYVLLLLLADMYKFRFLPNMKNKEDLKLRQLVSDKRGLYTSSSNACHRHWLNCFNQLVQLANIT